MRLSTCLNKNYRHALTAIAACVLAACGGSGGSDSASTTPIAPVITPTVLLTIPTKTSPITSGVATNLGLTAKFSQDMLASTINSTSFSVACPASTPVAGTITVTYDAASRLAILQHATDFTANTTCVATITKDVKNVNGVAMASNFTWSFTTAAGADNTPPTITSTSPIDAATGICTTKDVSITFSEPMDASTITATTFNVTNNLSSALVPGSITYDALNNIAKFAVTNPPGFSASTPYTVHITTGVKDLAGNALGTAAAISFTTSSQACAPPVTINLGTISAYGTFGGGAGSTNQGINTVVNGSLGTTAACTLFTGFHDAANVYTETTLNIGLVTGNILCGPPAPGTAEQLALATVAATDALTAYNQMEAMPSGILTNPELGTRTLLPGTYKSAASEFIITTGDLTLDAANDPNAAWIFQVPSQLTVGLSATPRRVILVNGALAKNVYWQVGSLARIENGSTMYGTIIAKAGVTISTAGQTAQTYLYGRAIGLDASVTMVNTTITTPF
ncbi:ice-binding family protein [Polynucleobacter sp. MG-28-Ekke-A2]|uniref:ice-binding family protein n=1 Tax=Polynucleobacter sp. MG-28-Ekke-A2 TaxID=3108276 RepID=UPI002B2322D8|nr:ice-binding family protein [Polynucleobacter sp. MG-28-Ekke-A2]MEA9601510.1 ice-binding family protein [Polynucleobacter sp. MG-28-Ekke-A2]